MNNRPSKKIMVFIIPTLLIVGAFLLWRITEVMPLAPSVTLPKSSDERILALTETLLECGEEMPEIEPASFFDYETIVINSFLMGAWDGDKWVSAETLYPMLPDKSLYTIYTDNLGILTSIGRKETHEEGFIGGINGGVVMDNVNSIHIYNEDFIALSSDTPLAIASTEEKRPDDPVYQRWVDQLCSENGHPDLKLTIREVYAFVGHPSGNIMYYVNADNDEPVAGQKGIVQFVRMAVDGVEQSVVLRKEFWVSEHDRQWFATELRYVCDLNHDGLYEIITYEYGLGSTIWGNYAIYSLRDGKYDNIAVEGWSD